MHPKAAPETLLILNPTAGSGRARYEVASRRTRIEARLGPLDWQVTRGPGDAAQLAARATAAGTARIVVAGGDGTTSEVVSGMLDAGHERGQVPRLGLLPVGSGCDLARSIGLPRDLEAALEVIATGAVRAIDAGRIEYRDAHGAPRSGWFVNEASAGLSAATVRWVASSRRRLGPRFGFFAGAVAAILSHRPRSLAVEIDGARVYEGPVSLVVAANGACFGAGMRVAPEARLDDGRLEIVLVRGMSMPRLLLNLPTLYSGRHLRHPRVSRHSARSLALIPKDAAAGLEVDGEALGGLPLRAEILPQALEVHAPSGPFP